MAVPPVRIRVDTSSLIEFSKKLKEAERVTKPKLATGLNEVGDDVVSLIAGTIAKQTGLTLDQVRGAMKVKRANRSALTYEVRLSPSLLEDPRTLEGKRESREFGKHEEGDLVIVVSRKDELVCMDCEELEAAGPMPFEVAKAHIPRHPNCRCIIMPYVQKGKRLPVTMTTLSGTDPTRRARGKMTDVDLTLRQLAQTILNRSAANISIALK
jgi:hypothetical protein